MLPTPAVKNVSQMKLIAAGTPFGVKFHTEGVVVVGICGNCGPAADAGLKKGDVIMTIDGNPVGNVGEFAEAIRNSNGAAVKLEYKSGGLMHTAKVEPILDENGEEIELSQIGEEFADDSKGGFVTAEDVGPAVLEEGDEDHYTLVDEDEIEEDFSDSEDEFELDGIDDDADFDEE